MSAQTAPTQYAFVGNVKLAYRRFGKQHGIPLIFLTHFRGTMDLVDPLLANSIAKHREFILFDYAGCGHSEGAVDKTLQQSGLTVVNFLNTIGIAKVDILGFSLGGMVAQSIAVEHPQVVNKIILAGTQSSLTEGIVFADDPEVPEISAQKSPTEDDMMKLFFYPSESSRALGRGWWKRTQERNVDGEARSGLLNQAGGQVQQAAIGAFVSDAGFFERLKQIDIPILVTNGTNDIMTPTPNSYLLQKHLRNAELHIYPDSGHGHLYQIPISYSKQLELFLA
ncbi:2-hydroxy-6-oxononadienedioate/2-hydroxy-6-oxononatrienedioate hydrolase [Stagonosporopsis vannaccii]|nr:2-hydroxy-6-oxononadienedioate/2-hydroxy-6-oxononatrienedioate hydrolase [Stagonosporopsis vannaccii]